MLLSSFKALPSVRPRTVIENTAAMYVMSTIGPRSGESSDAGAVAAYPANSRLVIVTTK